MSNKIRIVQYGVGPMGRRISQLALIKERLALVGAIDIDPNLRDRDIADVLGNAVSLGIGISGDAQGTLAKTNPDVVFHTTASSLERVFPQIREVVQSGANIVSTCEELAFPFHHHPQLSREIDRLAHQHNVTVLGTGVNPGFVMDKLVCTLMGVCQKVEHIHVKREVDVALRRSALQRKVGVGLQSDTFNALVAKGKIRHVGLSESGAMIAHVLGLKTLEITETIDPVIAHEDITTPTLTVKKGHVAGIEQVVSVTVRGQEKIALELRMTAGADVEADTVHLQGEPEINMSIHGGISGDIATASIVVNAVPYVLNARAGLITMLNVPISYWHPRNIGRVADQYTA